MTNYDKLIGTLKEVFMLDKAELDFGIYKIMNQKRKDIEQFLEKDLAPQVSKVLAESLSVDKQALQKELDEAIKQAQSLGADPSSLPKVQQLKVRLGEAADMMAIENEVFSLLANFFKRYFDNGDFLSMRRYKKDVYAIPYEGEEVKLHWANADQHYIKTSEYFKIYRFKLGNLKTVSFELIEASTEQNNNKTANDKERRFSIYLEQPSEVKDGELKIYFTYEPTDKKVKQSDLMEDAFNLVKGKIPQDFSDLLSLRPTEKDKQRTLLQKHLLDYTARNTFDYFIHKDLGGFLGRELDFYIKNEVLFIDDLNTRDEQEFLKQLSKIKAIKKIGEKIIAFLAQLENFQKKLWLKKKMVVECNYCITLDRVPHEFYSEIASNKAQTDEWIKLFSIDEIKAEKAGGSFPSDRVAFSNPVSIEFLKQNQFLVLDTAFFDEALKWKLIASIENFDVQCDGLMINSENFQAINLLQLRYNKSIRAIYLDPPYNTPHSQILYKNDFKHSSWLSLISNTTALIKPFFVENHSLGFAIDDYEVSNLLAYLNAEFYDHDISIITVNHHPQGSGGKLSRTHEYLIICTNEDSPNLLGKPLEDYQEDRSFMRSGTAENNFRHGRWKSFYALLLDLKSNKIIGAEPPIPLGEAYPLENTSEGYKRVYPINSRGEERVWRSSFETGKKRCEDGEIMVTPNGAIQQAIDHEGKREVLFSNWTDTKYNAGSYGSQLLTDMGLGKNFDYPKSINTMETALWLQTFADTSAVILDYFGGSGTTGHAVINLNRIDEGTRKYLLVEMGAYFDTATKPRVLKAIYSADWKEGKPVSRDGISHCLKYLRLEGYEDSLNNLTLKKTAHQELGLETNSNFKEGYMLNYMLDVEAQDSLLNLEWFTNPFNCYLNITRNNEMQRTRVDLVETFNYLIGLVVESYAKPKEGFAVVTGKTLSGESILVVWRDCGKHNSNELNKFLEKSKYNPLDSEFDRIYVNGDNNVENLKTGDERWKVVLIEEEFKKKMFENV